MVNAIKSIPSLADLLSTHDGHFDYELDLEVIVYGRNYGGKKVGPYVRLLTFEPGETIIKEGDWGGNTFYVAVPASAWHNCGNMSVPLTFWQMRNPNSLPANCRPMPSASVRSAVRKTSR